MRRCRWWSNPPRSNDVYLLSARVPNTTCAPTSTRGVHTSGREDAQTHSPSQDQRMRNILYLVKLPIAVRLRLYYSTVHNLRTKSRSKYHIKIIQMLCTCAFLLNETNPYAQNSIGKLPRSRSYDDLSGSRCTWPSSGNAFETTS